LKAALKPPVGPGQSLGGGPGAKPPEADEFLRVKGVFSSIYNNEHMKKYVKNFQTGGRMPGAKSAFGIAQKLPNWL
jgi:hypothetical protein